MARSLQDVLAVFPHAADREASSARTQVARRPSSWSSQCSLAANRFRHAPRCSGDSAGPTQRGADAPLADAAGSRPPLSPLAADVDL